MLPLKVYVFSEKEDHILVKINGPSSPASKTMTQSHKILQPKYI